MGKPLRALIVEDVEQDAVLVARELRRGGFDVAFERVDTPEAMTAALVGRQWDVVIADYSMPRFSAAAACALLRAKGLDTPLIIVSGSVGEETAVEAMRSGVQDYVLKGKLARLVPAIERELRESANRAAQQRMQEQLLISDRMASVGTLAAGVAHEINNPLAAMLVNLEVVAQDLMRLAQDVRSGGAFEDGGGDDPWSDRLIARLAEVEEPLQDARLCADRVRVIVRDLKVFSRSHDEESRGPVDVRRVLASSARMAWNEIRHRARVVEAYGDVPPALGNEARLGQVFLNLLVNAAQAIPEGSADRNRIRIATGMDEAGRIAVEIGDTGSGIPPEILPRIFDAFFTTKPQGVGTGLGLAICHRIVTSLGGEIRVESRVGEGTEFRVYLPVASPRPEAAGAGPSRPAPVSTRRGRILVVDDERVMATAIRRMLEAEHEVVIAQSAREVLERTGRGERFDLILCDLMMPQVTGMDLHAELVRVAADQAERMVFMTGGAFTDNARAFLDRVPNARLEKPFEANALRLLLQSRVS